jgi:hypothetical protein
VSQTISTPAEASMTRRLTPELSVYAQGGQRVGRIDAFKLRLGTCEQLVDERTERLQ